jgi:uncharacterized protein
MSPEQLRHLLRAAARIHGLSVTGSLGILIRAKKEGIVADLDSSIRRMRAKGIWISDALVLRTLEISGHQEM